MMLQTYCIAFTVIVSVCLCLFVTLNQHKHDYTSVRRRLVRTLQKQYQYMNRHLQSDQDYYYTITDESILGAINADAAIGNPMKGLLSSPDWSGSTTPSNLPTSLEFYYIGLDKVMIGDDKYDWSLLDKTLREAANRYKHVIWRVYCHYPGRPLAVPKYLLEDIDIIDGSPNYNDPTFLDALEKFISAFGSRYDGHKSLAFIQMGLLGYWGEWHTYPGTGTLSQATKTAVLNWYLDAFQITKLQARDPSDVPGKDIGFHDDSFAYSTLGTVSWYFWPKVIDVKGEDVWKMNVMGGETRPELQSAIFESTYKPGVDKNSQDFMECAQTTHATYMIHSDAFKNGGYSGTELENARRAHSLLGYNYAVSEVSALAGKNGVVSIDVTLRQLGVAPFYYPLSLVLECSGALKSIDGVERSLIELDDDKTFRFDNIPASTVCLKQIKLQLKSSFTYNERPIKFAQGDGKITFSLPLPNDSVVPTPSPVPIKSPVSLIITPSPAIQLENEELKPKLTLIDAKTGKLIKNMTNNMIINLPDYPSINVKADPPKKSFETRSIQFVYDGSVIQTESYQPYLISNVEWKPSLGIHTIEAIPFDEMGGLGNAGESESVTFTVVNQVASRVSFVLINADNDRAIGIMSNGMIIDSSTYPYINVRADVDPTFPVDRVEFSYDGELFRVERAKDFAFGGNNGEDFHAWKPSSGEHTIEATVFSTKSDETLYSSVTFRSVN